jgi:hypothetical protein
MGRGSLASRTRDLTADHRPARRARVRLVWRACVGALLVPGVTAASAQVVMDRSDRQLSDRQRNELFRVMGQALPASYRLRVRALRPLGGGRYCGEAAAPAPGADPGPYAPFFVDVPNRRAELAAAADEAGAERIAAACREGETGTRPAISGPGT